MNLPHWVVTDVIPNKDYTLLVTFVTGEIKSYNVLPLLKYSIFEPLNNLSFFLKAKVECGTVVWSDDVDIAPEVLYDDGILVNM